jgi:hypothetical protein
MAIHNVVLTWQAPADATVSSTYNIYRANGLCTGTPTFAKINPSAITVLTYTDSTVAVGSSYCYYGTQVQGATESLPSNQAGGTITPNTITIQLVIA